MTIRFKHIRHLLCSYGYWIKLIREGPKRFAPPLPLYFFPSPAGFIKPAENRVQQQE